MSVDPSATSKRLKNRLQASFTFLSDPEGVLLDAVGIRHRGGRIDGADIAYPTSLLVDEGGTVRWLYQADNYRERAKPEAIFAAIGALGPPRPVPAAPAEVEAEAGPADGATTAEPSDAGAGEAAGNEAAAATGGN